MYEFVYICKVAFNDERKYSKNDTITHDVFANLACIKYIFDCDISGFRKVHGSDDLQ